MALKPSISVIIPALNEEKNVPDTVNMVTEHLKKNGFDDFEIILIDDGSKDRTGEIMDGLCAKDSRILKIRNNPNQGIGYCFRRGVLESSKNYVGYFPGDNETLSETMDNIFSQIGQKDIIIPYTANPQVRPFSRRILSLAYTAIFNIMFGANLKYFNGTCFFRRPLLENVAMSSNGPSFMMEILVQLLKIKNASYIEVPMYIREQGYGKMGLRKSRLLKWKNVLEIAGTARKLFFRVYFPSKSGNKKPGTTV